MITITTDLADLILQQTLADNTKGVDKSILRMTSGYKVNQAKDNAANYSIITNLTSQISSMLQVQQNAVEGISLLQTAEGGLEEIQSLVAKLRKLTIQVANGTYGNRSIEALQLEADSIVDEISRIKESIEFNGQSLYEFNDGSNLGIIIQPFEADIKVDIGTSDHTVIGVNILFSAKDFFVDFSDIHKTFKSLDDIDTLDNTVQDQILKIGTTINRLDNVIEAQGLKLHNLVSTRSTLQDADIAEESSNYLKYSILQNASVVLIDSSRNLRAENIQGLLDPINNESVKINHIENYGNENKDKENISVLISPEINTSVVNDMSSNITNSLNSTINSLQTSKVDNTMKDLDLSKDIEENL